MSSSSKRVKIDGLADAIVSEIKKYNEDTTEILHKTAKSVATKGAKTLRTSSPVGKGSAKGHYADGWTVRTERPKKSKSSNIIHNKKKPGLAHLLEHGHQSNLGGRVSGKPHIKPVEVWCNEEFEKRLVERLEK